MFSVSQKYSFPVDNKISDKNLLEYMQDITDDELLSIFKIYSSSYEDGGNFVSVVSDFTNLINFIEKEQKVSQDNLNLNLKNLIDVNVSISNRKVHDLIIKYLNGLVDMVKIHQMAPKPEYIFEDILNKGVTLPDKVFQLTEFIEFILFATTNFRKVSGKPSKFSDIDIPASNEFHLFLDQRQILLYQVHIDVLKNITLHFIENPDAGLPMYFYEMESGLRESNLAKPSVGRNRNEIFTKEKVKEFVSEFFNNHIYPKPQRFWHIGGVQDGAIVKSELAKYIFFEKFKATENQFSLKSIESRIEEVIPKKYLPSYRKKINRKKKK
jgi:hypothetical protein